MHLKNAGKIWPISQMNEDVGDTIIHGITLSSVAIVITIVTI